MIKRAHLYSYVKPIADDVSDSSNDRGESEELIRNEDQDVENDELSNSNYIIKASTKGKALKCRCCPGKLILNDQDLSKHLDSKAHKKRVLIYNKNERKIEMEKQKFTKRIREMETYSDNSDE